MSANLVSKCQSKTTKWPISNEYAQEKAAERANNAAYTLACLGREDARADALWALLGSSGRREAAEACLELMSERHVAPTGGLPPGFKARRDSRRGVCVSGAQ